MAHYVVRILIAGILLAAVGCAPNAQGIMRPTLPWTRNAPQARTGYLGNPGARPNDLASIFSSPTAPPNTLPRVGSERWAFLNEMMRRADQQESLAEQQRQELRELQQLQQDQLTKDRDYVTKQRELERQLLVKRYADRDQKLSKQYAQKEQLLAERERQYKGRFDQIRGRATNLDANNRDLHAQLAKSERERQMLRDELSLVKDRLDESTQQLSKTRNVGIEASRRLQQSDQRLRALQASASRQVGNASIRANRSVGRPLTAVSIPGIDVRQDGDLVRIQIPTEHLFMNGTANLHQGSQPYLGQIAMILQQHYPKQMVAVEAHTDHANTSLRNTQWSSQHQLTAAQAVKVFDQLTARNINPHRLFVMGLGGNHPLVSEGTAAGQARNRRIEIVVYPEIYSR